MNNSITADTLLRTLALAVARNSVGANLPIDQVIAREGISQLEYDQLEHDPQFKKYTDAFVAELTNNGFSIQAKAQVLVEDLLPSIYHLARDLDAPAASRIKSFDSLVDLAGVRPKTDQSVVGTGSGFSVVINFPTGSANAISQNQGRVIEHSAEEAKNFSIPLGKAKETEELKPSVPLATSALLDLFSQSSEYEDYEDDDYVDTDHYY